MAEETKLKVVELRKEKPKKETPKLFNDALKQVLDGSEYMKQVTSEEIEGFALCFIDETGYKVLGSSEDRHVIKSTFEGAIWAMNFNEQVGELLVDDE